ncbi:MAG TPA: hypothetical protein VFR49_09455, partial [Solirubrobacteraceae bacterium]|nr:hypothetical protein [Solirubrobacteraceae bacterium]
MILALETSCDDTCAAVVTPDGRILANVISSQGVHDRYGGVVPEVAARHHLELIDAVTADALDRAGAGLDDVSLVAATQGPGLIGALLVGLASAKAIAAARTLPFAAVDHLRGHVAVAFLEPEPLEPPFVSLIASGGHTLLLRVDSRGGEPEILARTLDDIDLVAVTQGPGLVGALLIGMATAKGLAAGRGLPLAPVDHLQGHVAANFLEPEPLEPPFLCLVASGGHTLLAAVRDHGGHEILGQ